MSKVRNRSPSEVETVLKSVRTEIRKSVVGYEDQIEDFMICLLNKGHLLIEGVPGIAKTTLSKAFASVCGLSHRRIQFTQDLLPADITGHYYFNQRNGEFELRKGPLFAGFVLADEINRAPPKTQSALLEAMQEQQVTIEGNTFDLPDPFTVVATLNPIEIEGVYPLPEAQVDRFMIKSMMSYLSTDDEIEVLRMKSGKEQPLNIIVSRDAILEMQEDLATVHVHLSVLKYVEDLATATRSVEELDLGLSPRGAIHLIQTAMARAYLHGREYVIPDDVKAMAHRVINHRLILSPEGELGGMTRAGVTDGVLSSVPVPKGDLSQAEASEE